MMNVTVAVIIAYIYIHLADHKLLSHVTLFILHNNLKYRTSFEEKFENDYLKLKGEMSQSQNASKLVSQFS